MKKYLVQTMVDGELFSSIKTEKELAHHWETAYIADFDEESVAYDISMYDHPVKVSIEEIARPIIEQERWMQEEYYQYCQEERYN